MRTRIRTARRTWLLTSSGFATGMLAASTLLAAACSDSASRMLSPSIDVASSRGSTGASSTFAVLANAAVTCTDGTITGDVGTFQAAPTGSVTRTVCPIVGTVHVGDGVAKQAYDKFLAAYAALAPKPGDSCTSLTGTLAGVTLPPGVYCFDAAATLTGVLTLDGPSNGTWIFKIGTSGTGALTGTNFSVVMAGGGQACNVTWWVAQATTMTTSAFQGNILGGAAITLTGGTYSGNAWSKADVTVNGTAVVGCAGSGGQGNGNDKEKCNQGVGNGPEGCDPGKSNHHNGSNDEDGGTPGNPGRKGSH
ncbi:MAG TPA: ice-binding family protein [Gemmatimonadaceae bacterium]|nr:ice-binding family protein [Gemmatimonadaceae bacterium]